METDQEKLEKLLQTINYLNGNKVISLPTNSGSEFVTLNDIVRCEGDNNYTTFYLVSKHKIIVSKTLGEYEHMFDKYYFFRVHQSHLINLRHVKSYSRSGNMVTLSDGSNVEISRRKKLEFFKLFSI